VVRVDEHFAGLPQSQSTAALGYPGFWHVPAMACAWASPKMAEEDFEIIQQFVRQLNAPFTLITGK
jgi:hypothetical protein